MDRLTSWLERYFLPIASKMGQQKHLVALRDAFIGAMPATMAGSIAVLINAIFRDLPVAFNPNWNASAIPGLRELIAVNGYVWNGTLAIAGLMFAFSWGYSLAKAYKVNDLAGGIVSVAAFIQGIAFSFKGAMEVALDQGAIDAINAAGGSITADATGLTSAGWGWLKLGHLDGNAYFTIMIIGFIATMIYVKLMQKNITIKLPDSVPPAVSKAFTAIIPATVALYTVGVINFLINKFTDGQLLIDLIQKYIAEPFLGASQGLGWTLAIGALVSVFWFFGLHGTNILGPVISGVWGVAGLTNLNIGQEGYKGLLGAQAVKAAIADGKAYSWVSGSFDAFSWFGGAGATLALVIAILIASKRADYKAVAKIGGPAGLFNINEPIMFGLPIVLNPMMMIPFIIAPTITTGIAWGATQLGLVNPVYQSVPWVTPPVLNAFLATGADWRAAVLALINLAITVGIYLPFVILANKQAKKDGLY